MNSIKLRTALDFEHAPSSYKRKGHISLACESCRRLKIRCQGGLGGSAGPNPCDHCMKLSKDCVWPEEDFRKRPKASATTATELQPRVSASPAPPLSAALCLSSPQWENDNIRVAESIQPGRHCVMTLEGGDWEPTKSGMEEHVSIPSGSMNQGATALKNGIPYTTLQYYRHLGSTAIAPGYKKISLKLRQDDHQPQSRKEIGQRAPVLPLLDTTTGMPVSLLLPHLLDAFFEFYGDNFCFLNRWHLEDLARTGEASSFLICAMSALSSRFCEPTIFTPYFTEPEDGHERERWEFSLPFLDNAKRLLMPLLSIPSCDVCAGLLFIALAEFGDNNEAGMQPPRRYGG